jgi:hypothetical protein
MEETFSEKAFHALVFLGICGAIIFVGWNEPLRYRFMSSEAIVEQETPPEPPRTQWLPVARPTGTALDRAPYEIREGKVRYSRSFDSKQMGAPTETDRRANTIGKQ